MRKLAKMTADHSMIADLYWAILADYQIYVRAELAVRFIQP